MDLTNTLAIDKEYLQKASVHLKQYKLKSTYPFVANFRCPFCGDSQKDKFKARGYCFEPSSRDHLKYKCQNCGVTTNVGRLLRTVDSNMYDEYVFARFREKQFEAPRIAKPLFEKREDLGDYALSELVNAETLFDDHPLVKYLQKRRIPLDKYSLLYYVPDTIKWAKKYQPAKFGKDVIHEPEFGRLAIPFFSEDGHCLRIQLRSIDQPNDLLAKYLNVEFTDDPTNIIYGAERLDTTKPLYVTEGPIDSLFIPNAAALAGVSNSIRLTGITYVLDNQPRNKAVVAIYKKLIDAGEKVVIWPENIEGKDVNDLIMDGYSQEQLLRLLEANTYSGLLASSKFSEWKKV